MIARGCGIGINVMTSLLILLMCRILITKIRLSDCAQYIPVDHHVSYHKIIGLLNLILALIHSIVHIINGSVALLSHFHKVLALSEFAFLMCEIEVNPGPPAL